MRRVILWLALRFVSAVAVLVPAPLRDEWKREWMAELQHGSRDARRQRTWSSEVDVGRRALGSLPDAAWIRRQFTLDADAVRDATHGVRMLVKTPGFTLVALLVFAVGIGASTAVLSVADALFWRPIPVADPGRVMTVWQYNRATGRDRLDVAPGNAIDWMTHARSFESVGLAVPSAFNLALADVEAGYLTAAMVTEQFFGVLGTPMSLGRAFVPEEFRPNGPRVAIFSHAMWSERHGRDPDIVGKRVRLDEGDPYTVVGVLPQAFVLRLFDDRGRRPEPYIWLPKQGFADFEPSLRGQGFWNVVGRLGPGVTAAQAQAELDALSRRLAEDYPQTNGNVGAHVVPLRLHLVGSLRDVLPILVGAAVILLVVACANVANLLLARGAVRRRELAVRQALGASRIRLLRQMLVESLVLASAGGALGLALARWTLDVIAALRPRDIALVDSIPIDARSAAIACGVTIAAALIAGLVPSIQLSRAEATSALREGRAGSRRGIRGALVVFEVAAALVLAVGAGLLVRSFMLIQQVDPGFVRDNVSVMQVFTTRRHDTPDKRIVFFGDILDRVRSLPGVVAAGGVTSMPFGEALVLVRGTVAVAGRPPANGDDAVVSTSAVSGDYFQAMGVPLLRGRLFDRTETADSQQVVVVSQSAARQFWPGADPIGSRLRFRMTGRDYDAEVVGIVGDVRHEGLDLPSAAEVFVPYAQSGFYALTIVARTAPNAPVGLETLKQQVWALDPQQSIFHTGRLEALVSKTLTGERFNLFLLGGFALATLVVAVAGVYGVMSFSTSQRTREFGLRLALGATRHDIRRLVLGEGLTLAGLGVVIGVIAALPLTRLLTTLLFGITATDPTTFVSVSAVLVLVSIAACYVPMSRALKVDPARVLRLD